MADRFDLVVIGSPDHVEVRGLVGDLEEYMVIRSEAEVPRLAGRSRLGGWDVRSLVRFP